MARSTANDLLERENQAGNAEDSLSVGQKNYDEQFNRISSSPENEDFDAEMDAKYGKNGSLGSKKRVDGHGDTVQSNYNADEIDSTRKDTKDQEESGGKNSLNYRKGESTQPTGRLASLKKGIRKIGPSAGISAFVLTAFSGISILMAPAALITAIEKASTNHGNDASRTNTVMRRAFMGNIFGTVDTKNCTGVKCKFKTVSEAQIKKWENLKFQVDKTETGNKRFKINKLTFPDGKEVTSGKAFNAYVDNNIEGRRTAGHVFNMKAKFFQDPKTNTINKKFGISKSKILKSSNSKDKVERKAAIDKSFNENTAAGEDKKGGIARITKRLNEAKSKMNSIASSKGFKITSAAAAVTTIACMSYNTLRVSVATVKAEWIYQLIAFAYPFVQVASQIQDQGNVDASVVENIGDRLTWYDNKKEIDGKPNPQYNLSATDSQGLKSILYGDFEALKDFTKDYTTGKVAYAVIGSSAIESIKTALGGQENIREICRTGAIASAATSATCLLGPWALAACALVIGALFAFGDDIIGFIIDKLTEPALEVIKEANLTSDLKGVDAGNALAAGIGLYLSYGSMGSGMKPAKSVNNGGVNQVKNFLASTDKIINDQVELAKYEARETPFDVHNQYSFAGSIATAINPYNAQSRGFFEVAANTMAVLTTPFSTLTQTANALNTHSQPSQLSAHKGAAEGNMKNCEAQDPDYAAVGLSCDSLGRPIFVSSPRFLDMASRQADGEDVIGQVVDSMTGTDIEEAGKEKDDSEYSKWKKYCSESREDPIGLSSHPIEEGSDDDQKWYDMSACAYGTSKTSEDRLDDYNFYFNMCERQFPAAEETGVETCFNDSPTTTSAPATKNTGDWVIPTSGPCLSPYGQRWGALHAGIDISPPAGTPIVAPTSMKITKVSDTGDGYGTSITGTATDGSGNSFRLAHMIAGSPTVSLGQEVSKGEKIGEVGSTGDSTGPHLHFEIFPEGVNPAGYSGATDPVPVLAQHGVAISC